MKTITHKTGAEVVVSYFGDLKEKMAVATGYVRAFNAYNQMLAAQQGGILRPTLSDVAAHKAIVKAHNKFYGLTSKYDGRGRLRAA